MAHPAADDVWDVAVVGAGPAGSSAALGALRSRPGARVLLIDSSDFPRDKVCGDGIAPHAVDVLRDLGVDAGALVAGTEPIHSLRLRSPGGLEASRRTRRAAFVVPRVDFDDRLVSAATRAGAVLRRHRVRTVAAHGDGVVLDRTIRARVVVGADGAESMVRRAVRAAPPRPGSVAIALRGYVPSDGWPGGEQLLTMSRAHWPAYAWAFPIGDGRANVGYGELLRGPPPSRAELEERLRTLLDVAPVGLRGHRLPLSTGRPRVAHGRVLLAGDAASLINPLTGEGIYYAVLSGSLAGAAALETDPASTYRRALRAALGAHLRQTDVLARMTRRPFLLDCAVGAARDSQSAFDALVDIGLGAGRITVPLLAGLVRSGLRGRR